KKCSQTSSSLLSALAGAASAAVSNGGLKLLVPGGDNLWWITGQPNNIIWSCSESTFTQFTMCVPVEQNFNCAQLIAGEVVTMPVGKGYTIVLTDITNATNVYAVSDPFEIKALSAGYPPATNTPVDSQSATVSKGTASNVISGSQTGTGSGSSPSQTGTGAASSLRSGMAAAGALVGAAVIAALL
ncbi:hypothetical protein B0H14DRAFT_2842452, partial [Mycena olivaceomarginata]